MIQKIQKNTLLTNRTMPFFDHEERKVNTI